MELFKTQKMRRCELRSTFIVVTVFSGGDFHDLLILVAGAHMAYNGVPYRRRVMQDRLT
jgi:hypothetical protein